jgi:hypothetical protein
VKVASKINRSLSAALRRDCRIPRAYCRGARVSRSLISGVALAALLAGTIAAKADDSDVAAQIKELKAQIRALERRVDQQQRTVSRVVIRQAQVPAAAPYEPPHPWDKKFYLNGITITPGGFLAAEGVWRSRDTGGDFSPAFGSLPSYTSPAAHMNELRGTARQSRISALVQGNYNPDTLISGYGEFDFLGAGVTANSTESNSYQPRVRNLYGTIDWQDEGFHILAGQSWSLATLQGKGISPRNETIPATIDAQYVAGFTWARQPQIRLTKNFGDEFWVAASAELAQTLPCAGSNPTAAAVAPTPVGTNEVICSQVPSGGSGVLNTAYKYSFNHLPDVIAKAAWEPTIADRTLHIEGFGLYTDLYDYVEPSTTATTAIHYDTPGWGAGGGITIPVLPKLVDIQGSGIIGRGIGRYGSSQLTGATFNPNGSLDPLPELMFLGGLTVHATPQLDLYAYGGEERLLSADWTGVKGAGYVSPAANNSGCYILNDTAACTGAVQDAWELTGGFWDKVYQGAFGSVRVGLQYAYIQDDLFPGTGGGVAANTDVHYNNQMVYASFRYYPFDPPPAAPPLVAKY